MVSLFGLGGNGYLSQLEQILSILAKLNIDIEEVEDLRVTPKINFTPVTETYWADLGKVWPKGHQQVGQPIMLRDYQVDAVNTFLVNTQSLQEIATGAGKTITTATLSHLSEKYGRSIVIVPNKSLVEQTEEDFINVGLDVGVYYGDRKDLHKTHTICTWQSLNILDKKSKNHEQDILTLAEFLDGVKTVIVDEVHMAKAEVLKNERVAEIEASKSVQVQQIKSAESSWKDEYLTVVFTAILVAHFIPPAMPFMAQGWELLKSAPQEFWWVILTIVSGSFGMHLMYKFKK
jgi:ATP:corrinoid adenosyltransferase